MRQLGTSTGSFFIRAHSTFPTGKIEIPAPFIAHPGAQPFSLPKRDDPYGGRYIPDYIWVHEETHAHQQCSFDRGAERWWSRYLTDAPLD